MSRDVVCSCSAVVKKLNNSLYIRGRLMQQKQPAWPPKGHSDLCVGLFHFERTVSLNTERRECVEYEMAFTQLVSRTLTTTLEWNTFLVVLYFSSMECIHIRYILMCVHLTTSTYITHAEVHMYKKHFAPMPTLSVSWADNITSDEGGGGVTLWSWDNTWQGDEPGLAACMRRAEEGRIVHLPLWLSRTGGFTSGEGGGFSLQC